MYIRSTVVGRRSLEVLACFFKVKHDFLLFRLLDVKDEEGNLLRIRVVYEDRDKIYEYILADKNIKEAFTYTCKPYERQGTYLAKKFFDSGFFDDNVLWKKLLFINVIRWAMQRQGLLGCPATVFIDTGLCQESLFVYAQELGLNVVAVRVPRWHIRDFIDRLIGEQQLLYFYFYLLDVGVFKFIKRVLVSIVPSSQRSCGGVTLVRKNFSTVLVEYYGQFNVGQPHLYSDLFFLPHTQIPPQDVMMYFNIKVDPFDEQKRKSLQEQGIRALITHPKATRVQDVESFYYWPQAKSISYAPLAKLQESSLKRWLTYQSRNYVQEYQYWQELFAKHQVGLYVSWFKYGSRHCVIADALQSIGGVTAFYQRALEDFSSIETRTCVDVFYGFSAKAAALEKSAGSQIPYYVITGYGGDYRFNFLRPYAQQLREQLIAAGAKKVIAFFDENSHDDYWNTGHAFTQDNYTFLLEKVLEEPWLGVIFKPKASLSLRKRLGPVAALLLRAEATGRCIVCEKGVVGSSYPPALAALASDVAIHGHLCAATAGLESALTGTPTLLLDREGWPKSSLYGLGLGRVVFNDWQYLWDTCHLYLDHPYEDFGNWSAMIKDFDPFCDGKAVQRMGEHMTCLWQGLKQGLPRNQVLANAAEQYAKKWGKDKIIFIK